MDDCEQRFRQLLQGTRNNLNNSFFPLVIVKDRFIVVRNETSFVCNVPMSNSISIGKYKYWLEPISQKEITYQPFDRDFGPVNLALVYRFNMRMNTIFQQHPDHVICLFFPSKSEQEANAAFLCGCYAILGLGLNADDVFSRLSYRSKFDYLPFRDAGYGRFQISLLDCLNAVQRAVGEKLLDFEKFNVREYEHFEKVENGDLNWIVPGRLLAFVGPTSKPTTHYKAPEAYFEYFHLHNISLIVRLNSKTYDRQKFLSNGFDHEDLFFEDGSSPSIEIMEKFLEVCEKTDGAVAVHCKAGLGRTGTLIACYLIKHHRFRSREAIAWARICRPGSIIGPQQSFLEMNENLLRIEGEEFRSRLTMEHNDMIGDCLRCSESSEKLLVSNCNVKSSGFQIKQDSLKKITSEVEQIYIDQRQKMEKEEKEKEEFTQGDWLNMKKLNRQPILTSDNKRITRSQSKLEENQPPNVSKIADVKTKSKDEKCLKKNFSDLFGQIKEIEDFDVKINRSNESKVITTKSSNVDKRTRSKVIAPSTVTHRTRTLAQTFCKNRVHCQSLIKTPNLIQSSSVQTLNPTAYLLPNEKDEVCIPSSTLSGRKTSQIR